MICIQILRQTGKDVGYTSLNTSLYTLLELEQYYLSLNQSRLEYVVVGIDSVNLNKSLKRQKYTIISVG